MIYVQNLFYLFKNILAYQFIPDPKINAFRSFETVIHQDISLEWQKFCHLVVKNAMLKYIPFCIEHMVVRFTLTCAISPYHH
jgi:hypothetical protein